MDTLTSNHLTSLNMSNLIKIQHRLCPTAILKLSKHIPYESYDLIVTIPPGFLKRPFSWHDKIPLLQHHIEALVTTDTYQKAIIEPQNLITTLKSCLQPRGCRGKADSCKRYHADECLSVKTIAF